VRRMMMVCGYDECNDYGDDRFDETEKDDGEDRSHEG